MSKHCSSHFTHFEVETFVQHYNKTVFFTTNSEMPISKADKVLVLNKLCENLLKLEPQELPTLAFQLFTLSSTPAQLMIPLISLNQYFQKYLYQKQLDQCSNSESLNFDSIGELETCITHSEIDLNQKSYFFLQIDFVILIYCPHRIPFYII